jgi:two-component sensor histidine kinase/putative methionine-R-sulfoxide reductase with GAF domain
VPVQSLQEQLAQKTRELRAIGEISAALASAWELSTTLEVITGITSRVMGVVSCSVYLQDKATGRLVLNATTGLARSALGHAFLEPGEGLTGWTVAHGKPVNAADALSDPRFKLLPEAEETTLRSLLAVPLIIQGRTIGAMNVQTHEIHQYAEDEVELLSLIGNLAAGALEKAQLYDRMRQQIAELEGLVKVSRTVISPLYLDEMLKVVVEMAERVMGAQAVALHLLEDGGALVLRASHLQSAAPDLAMAMPVIEQVALLGKPASVPDLRADARCKLPAGQGPLCLLAVPLVVRERAVGVLSCLSQGRREFAQTEIDLFSMLANQTALATENARLVISAAVVQEMHHRVKNNLQTVAMLLRLQMGAAEDAKAKSILADAIARILSIASVHETLSEHGLKLVDVGQVLERVTRAVAETVLDPGRNITIEVKAEPVSLPSKAATSIALVATELIQNAIKHAFAGRTQGRIAVRLFAGPRECRLEVEDDGVGDQAIKTGRKGLGMEIVDTLVKHDLKGSFETTATSAGTRVAITFPRASNGERT